MKYLIAILLSICFFFAAKQSAELYTLQTQQTELKEDFAEINLINYGLFNMQLWKDKALEIFNARIQDFEIDPKLYQDVNKQLRFYLNDFYQDYFVSGKIVDEIVNSSEGGVNKMFLKMIKGNIGNMLKNIDLKSRIPAIADQLTLEIKKNEPVFKSYLTEELSSLLFDDEAANYTDPRLAYLEKYQHATLDETSDYLKASIAASEIQIQAKLKNLYYLLLACILIALLCIKLLNFRICVLALTMISILMLALGISLPMIDIDARLNAFNFQMIGSNISFDEQIMYYQSKSILDVTSTLISSYGIDTKIVGYLVLLFSVVFPFFKLTLSTLYLFMARIRKSRLAELVIFYLGKWSMADVFVVAIFMAYIGFYGIVTSQLMAISNNDGGFAVETLNYSKLSPGALFFTSYCILSIITSLIINRNKDKELV